MPLTDLRGATRRPLLITSPLATGKRTALLDAIHEREGVQIDITTPPSDVALFIGKETIDELRAGLQAIVHHTPYSLSSTYILHENLHGLPKASADILLKLLEDPPPHMKIGLTATTTVGIPRAIISRAAIIQPRPTLSKAGHKGVSPAPEKVTVKPLIVSERGGTVSPHPQTDSSMPTIPLLPSSEGEPVQPLSVQPPPPPAPVSPEPVGETSPVQSFSFDDPAPAQPVSSAGSGERSNQDLDETRLLAGLSLSDSLDGLEGENAVSKVLLGDQGYAHPAVFVNNSDKKSNSTEIFHTRSDLRVQLAKEYTFQHLIERLLEAEGGVEAFRKEGKALFDRFKEHDRYLEADLVEWFLSEAVKGVVERMQRPDRPFQRYIYALQAPMQEIMAQYANEMRGNGGAWVNAVRQMEGLWGNLLLLR